MMKPFYRNLSLTLKGGISFFTAKHLKQFFPIKKSFKKKLATTPFMQCSHSSVGFRAFDCYS